MKRLLWFKDGQTELQMIDIVHFNKHWKTVKVVRESKLYYWMENGDQVYKSNGWQKCDRYPHKYKGGVYFSSDLNEE